MALLTSQRINDLYTKYQNIEITFNKSVIRAVRLVSGEIYLKCLGNQWRCVLYSCSMNGVRVVMNIDNQLMEIFRKANNAASIRLCFQDPDKMVPVSFFVASKITGFTPYKQDDTNLHFISLKFNNQPPEDLISVIGLLVEANINAKNRAEERIVLNEENSKLLGIANKSTVVNIGGIPRACIVRDLSFAGCKVIISGIGKFLINKTAILKLEMEDLPHLNLTGAVLRYDTVEGRKDLSTLGIKFDEKAVPIEYKMRINDYFLKIRKKHSS